LIPRFFEKIHSVAIIYFIENHPKYADITQVLFTRIEDGRLQGITSPICLAECLVVPQRNHDMDVIRKFTELITSSQNMAFVSIGQSVAEYASILRAKYKLGLPDALQLATAFVSGCDAFFTNDGRLKHVGEV
jgi:predicted nucleic acid-binding protein